MPERTANRAVHEEHRDVLVLSALLMVVLIGCAGLALDVGKMSDRYRQAQNAADAAALGAAYTIQQPGTTVISATNTARSLVQTHNLPPTDLTSLTFVDATGAATTTASAVVSVTAEIHDSFPTIFMHVLGIHTRWVNATAVARVGGSSGSGTGSGGSGSCGVLCVLNPTQPKALELASNATVKVTGGNITVNSSASSAAHIASDGNIYAPEIDVRGSATYDSGGKFHQCGTSWTGTSTTSCSAGTTALTSTVGDPLANVPVPSCPTDTPCTPTPPPTQACTLTGTPASVSTDVNCSIAPGVYKTLTANSCSTMTLKPGIYIITGQLTSTSDCSITGTNVMLYFTCSSTSFPYYQPCSSTGQAGGSLSLTSGGNLNLSAPTSGTYQGMAIYYDRNNTSPLTLASSGSVNVTGTIYAKSAAIQLESGGSITLNSMLVADTAYLASSGGITIKYKASQNYDYSAGTGTGTGTGTSSVPYLVQ